MTASTPITPDAQQAQQDRKRKRKAILAGGVVLGLGAAVTLAAWSDDVFANGVFNTGSFELEGNVGLDQSNATGTWEKMDGGSDADSTGVLAFTSNPQTLEPNEEVLAPLALRLSDATTADASSVVLSSLLITGGPTTTPDGPRVLEGKLDYAVYKVTDATSCSADAAGTPVLTGTIDDADGSVTSLGTLSAPNSPTGDRIIPLCLGVTLTSNAEDVQGVSDTTVTWQFTGQTADGQIDE